MPGCYEICWLPENRTAEFVESQGNYYELEDGSRLDLKSRPVWCHHCATVTDGEWIESLAEIDQLLADLRDPNSKICRLVVGVEEFHLELIEQTKKRRWWREHRRAEPKCLACGSTDIVVFPINKQVPNLAGPGTVEVKFVGMCSGPFTEAFFTPEGDRLPRAAR
jgi:hypothetical protein